MSDRNGRLKGKLTSARGDRWLALPLLALALPVFLLGLGSPALYDPHESLYAEIAREMVVRGDWLTPHLNGTRYLDKPPLFYWLIAVSYTVFGVSEFSARLPIALAGLGGVLVTWGIGRHLFDGRSGALAGLVLTTSVGYFVFSRQLLPDMVFTCFTTLTFYGFLRAGAQARTRQPWSLLAYAGLAMAVMTKGFVGLFPLVVLAAYGLLSRSVHALRGMRSFRGGLLFCLLAVPWHLTIGWQHEGYFWHYFVNEHVLRFLGQRHPLDFISLPLPIFFLVLFLWLLPWSPYLAMALPRGIAPPRGRGAPLDAPVGEPVPPVLRHVTGAFAAVLPAGDARPGAADRREPRQALRRRQVPRDGVLDRYRRVYAAAGAGAAPPAVLSRSLPSAGADRASRIPDTRRLRPDGGGERTGTLELRPRALAGWARRPDGRHGCGVLLHAPGPPATPAVAVEPGPGRAHRGRPTTRGAHRPRGGEG